MSTALAPAQLNEIAAHWRAARQLYPVYAAVIRQHGIALEPSRDLEYPVDRSEPEAIARIKTWFAEADAKIEVWQMRQVLQTSELGSEPALGALIARLLEKNERSESDRDKIDFLLAQYFFHCAPAKLHQGEPTLDDVAEVLEPVLGESIPEAPGWLAPLEEIIAELRGCESLNELMQRSVLARARKLKTESGEMFFGSGAMLTFTRFNFLVRGTFVRLIHHDLHAIRFALHELEQRGQKRFDCSSVGLGAEMSGDQVRQFCHEWKTIFRAAYSSGQPFQQLIKLRDLLETAVAAPPEPVVEPAPAAPEPPPPLVAAKPAPLPPAPAPEVEVKKVEPKPGPKAEKQVPAAPTPVAIQQAVAAAYKPAPKQQAQKATAKTAPSLVPGHSLDIESCLEQIAEQLLKDSAKKGVTVTAVTVAEHKLMLSSWEVAAFVEGGDDVSDALQRAVAARALLSRAAEDLKEGKEVALAPVLASAHDEAAALQAQVAVAKEKKNIDAAVNLAASARRLIGMLEEIEKTPKPPQRSGQ
jgi:hypothetical protein